MRIVSRISAALAALRRKRAAGTTRETYVFDRKKGTVELRTHPHLIIKMELFKRFTQKKSWGFELTVRNRSTESVGELLMVFNKKYSIIFDNLKPDSMKIKSLELKPEEFDSDEFQVDASVVLVQGKKAVSEAYSLTIPMSSIISELKDLGKIIPIQEESDEGKAAAVDKEALQGFEAESMRQASIKPRISVGAEGGKPSGSKDALEAKLRELESQKTEITKSFMRREIDYSTFSNLMNPIVQEMILIKAQLGKGRESE